MEYLYQAMIYQNVMGIMINKYVSGIVLICFAIIIYASGLCVAVTVVIQL